MLKEPEFRLCPYSDTLFIAKRQNQVFASAEDRIAFHNYQNNFLRKKLSSINKQLLKSYKVADALLGDNIDVVAHKHFMRGRGFSFLLFTHVVSQNDEIVYWEFKAG